KCDDHVSREERTDVALVADDDTDAGSRSFVPMRSTWLGFSRFACASVDNVRCSRRAINVSESPGLTTYSRVETGCARTGLRVCRPSAVKVARPATPSAARWSPRW